MATGTRKHLTQVHAFFIQIIPLFTTYNFLYIPYMSLLMKTNEM